MSNEQLKNNDPLNEKSFSFSLCMVKLFKYMQNDHKEHILSKKRMKQNTGLNFCISLSILIGR